MRDYGLRLSDGRCVPVAEMTTVEIIECLAEGIQVLAGPATEQAIRDRLELELFIRERNLRCTT